MGSRELRRSMRPEVFFNYSYCHLVAYRKNAGVRRWLHGFTTDMHIYIEKHST